MQSEVEGSLEDCLVRRWEVRPSKEVKTIFSVEKIVES